jgi:hypothetical protein
MIEIVCLIQRRWIVLVACFAMLGGFHAAETDRGDKEKRLEKF